MPAQMVGAMLSLPIGDSGKAAYRGTEYRGCPYISVVGTGFMCGISEIQKEIGPGLAEERCRARDQWLGCLLNST